MPSSEVIYTEASNWLRLVNTICWQMAAIFIPLTLASFVYALNHPVAIIWLGSGSVIMWLIWTYVIYKYICSANDCRAALESIEKEDGVLDKQRFYSNQRLSSHNQRAPVYVLIGSSLVLIIAWVVLYFLRYGHS
ncbi:MAG: hypothetical protein GQ583_09990 [Methyloprofundus sp.]|nr:hypothetical protein [Methyloprofundus sp.]